RLTRARGTICKRSEEIQSIFNCCINSCVAYTGVLSKETFCPHCSKPYLKPNGQACCQYAYLPLIPQLQAQYAQEDQAKLLTSYQGWQNANAPVMTNIFQELCQCYIKVSRKTLPSKYFNSPRDLALGLLTDGFAPFKGPCSTAWPTIIFNYNLPPMI
ncbi:hypothetical protein DACRYDRAFT_51697, partial [Dacryopinax primogenitus]